MFFYCHKYILFLLIFFLNVLMLSLFINYILTDRLSNSMVKENWRKNAARAKETFLLQL
jgi:hypothetical protein